MSDILDLLKRKLFLIGAFMMLLNGAVFITLGGGEGIGIVFGIGSLVLGLILFISGYITPIVSESNNGKAIGFILILGAIVGLLGVAFIRAGLEDIAYPMAIAGPSITWLMFITWPCICCQGSRGIRSQIIGIASAHDSITMTELSNITGASVKLTSEIVYDAIGKRELQGRMEGGTFVRAATASPTYSAPSTTTREREVVKVLVICPYCGAKTEQGLSKCQNCQADL